MRCFNDQCTLYCQREVRGSACSCAGRFETMQQPPFTRTMLMNRKEGMAVFSSDCVNQLEEGSLGCGHAGLAASHSGTSRSTPCRHGTGGRGRLALLPRPPGSTPDRPSGNLPVENEVASSLGPADSASAAPLRSESYGDQGWIHSPPWRRGGMSHVVVAYLASLVIGMSNKLVIVHQVWVM
jgi:hypothetical protein